MNECDTLVITEVEEHTVVITEEESFFIETEGTQGPPGLSAYQLWQLDNPTGTFDDFMAELGATAVWNTLDW